MAPLKERVLSEASSPEDVFGAKDPPAAPGALDGLTLMRYAHVYRGRTSGGVEQYLRQLNRGLLQRHRLTVLQMHLVKDDSSPAIEVEDIGLGRILWVPVPVRQADFRLSDLPKRMKYVVGQTRRLGREEGQGQQGMFSSTLAAFHHQGGHLRYQTTILSNHLSDMLGIRHVDLLVLHWLSYDTGALIRQSRKNGIPYVFINHFENARLSLPDTEKRIAHAAGIGAVSNQGIPDSLRNRYVNLSDAVDTEFFAPEKARPAARPASPIVLLPGRIDQNKGHRDLIAAARILAERKLDFALVFPGAADSEHLQQELRRSAVDMGLGERICFPGEKSPEEMRDLYGMSSLIVLPSHSEGLGRVLLEAQAMKKPVVAYDSGGMRDAVLPNESGFLVKAGSVEGLADKIGFLLENEAERLRMGERGREFVSRQFSVAALVRRHERFYLDALSPFRRP